MATENLGPDYLKNLKLGVSFLSEFTPDNATMHQTLDIMANRVGFEKIQSLLQDFDLRAIQLDNSNRKMYIYIPHRRPPAERYYFNPPENPTNDQILTAIELSNQLHNFIKRNPDKELSL